MPTLTTADRRVVQAEVMLQIRRLALDTGREHIAVMVAGSSALPPELFRSFSRVTIAAADRAIIATLMTSDDPGLVGPNELGLAQPAFRRLGQPTGTPIALSPVAPSESLDSGANLRADAIVPPLLDDVFDLTPPGAQARTSQPPKLTSPDSVGRIDWHNERSRLLLEISARLEPAPADQPRAAIVSRALPSLLMLFAAAPANAQLPSGDASAGQKLVQADFVVRAMMAVCRYRHDRKDLHCELSQQCLNDINVIACVSPDTPRQHARLSPHATGNR